MEVHFLNKPTKKKTTEDKKKTNKILFLFLVVFYHDLKHRGDNLFTLFYFVAKNVYKRKVGSHEALWSGTFSYSPVIVIIIS